MKDNLNGIGIFGRRHYDYLKATKPTVINVMRMNGTLNSYLKSVDTEAEEMLFQLVNQMAKAEGITEQLKATDQMKWVQLMNNIHNWAEQIVNYGVVYT